jgi:hypothetical protein
LFGPHQKPPCWSLSWYFAPWLNALADVGGPE